jgi:TP901 family phage tail tape measure protein
VASAGSIKAGEAFVELGANDAKFNAALNRAAQKLQRFGADLRRIGAGAVGAGVVMAPVVATFVAFDDAMRTVLAVTSATTGEFDSLTATAKELGRTSGFTAVQVALLMTELGRAGFKPAQIEDMTRAMLNLARASGVEPAFAADVVGRAVNTWKLSAADAVKVADQLTAAANSSAVNMTDLAYAFNYSAQSAARLGVSTEDTLAVLAQMGQMGIRGEQAGTSFRRILELTGAQAAEMKKIFGVDALDAAGNLRPVVDVLDEVQQSLAGLGTGEAGAKLNQFFGLLGVGGATIIGTGAKSIREFQVAIKNSAGEAERTARIMDSGLGGAWRRLKGSAIDSAIALGESLAPALGLVGAGIVGLLNELTALINGNVEAATAIAATVIALTGLGLAAGVAGLAMKGFGAVVFVVKAGVLGLTAALAVAKLVLLAFTSAAVALPLLVGALFAGIVLGAAKASGALGTLGEMFRGVGAIVRETFGGVVAAFKKGDIGLAWDILLTGLHAAYLGFVVGLRKAWFEFTNYFRDAFGGAVLAIRQTFLDMLIGIVEGLNRASAALKGLAGTPEHKAIRAKAQPELTPVENEADAVRKRRRALEAEFDAVVEGVARRVAAGGGLEGAFADAFVRGIDAGGAARRESIDQFAGRLGGGDAERRDAILKAIDDARKREKELIDQFDKIMEKHKLGEQWIDTRPFEQAKKDLADLDARERDARNKQQAERLAAIEAEKEAKLAALRELVKRANMEIAPMPREFVDPRLAPMPRPAGGARAGIEQEFGTAAKGLWQSADFRGALAIGPAATDIGKQQLGKLTEVVAELKEIKQRIEPGVFV